MTNYVEFYNNKPVQILADGLTSETCLESCLENLENTSDNSVLQFLLETPVPFVCAINVGQLRGRKLDPEFRNRVYLLTRAVFRRLGYNILSNGDIEECTAIEPY